MVKLLKADKSYQPNILTNAHFQIWQRGESITPTSVREFVADRWRVRGTVDGSVTYSKYGENNGMLITNISSSSANSNFEQIIELDDRTIHKLFSEGISLQLRFNRTGTGDSGKTSLSFQFLDESQNSLYDIRESATNDGTSNVRTLTLTAHPDDIEDYKSSTKYIAVRILNENMVAGARCAVHWTKAEFGVVATKFEPTNYLEDFSICEQFYAIRGINTRFDVSSTTATYRYSIPFDKIKNNPSITLLNSSSVGNLTADSISASFNSTYRRIDISFKFSSSGTAKQAVVVIALDSEIY